MEEAQGTGWVGVWGGGPSLTLRKLMVRCMGCGGGAPYSSTWPSLFARASLSLFPPPTSSTHASLLTPPKHTHSHMLHSHFPPPTHPTTPHTFHWHSTVLIRTAASRASLAVSTARPSSASGCSSPMRRPISCLLAEASAGLREVVVEAAVKRTRRKRMLLLGWRRRRTAGVRGGRT